MHPDFWHERWQMGQIGFHMDQVHPDLAAHEDWLIGGGDHRVLVPLCGKSHDLDWLARKGNDVVGVELSEIAVRELFEREGREPSVEPIRDGLTRFHHDGLTVLCGDVFDVRPDHVGPIDRVWDRAALVALPAEMRDRYVVQLRALTRPGTRVLLNTLVYNESRKQGPPHSVDGEEIRRHYRGAEIELYSRRDMSDQIRPPWRDVGITRLESLLHRIVLPGEG